MKHLFFGILLLCFGKILGQSATNSQTDLRYREDQFYIGGSYNWLISKPSEIKQFNFSRNLFAGFIRDFPLNSGRNIGVGVGVGYNYNLLYTNIGVTKNNAQTSYSVISIDGTKIEKNYFENHQIELIPLEFRWRTSTPYTTKFWRIYTGIKASYAFAARYKIQGTDLSTSFSATDFKNYWDYKAYISIGHNTWNLFLQYSFVPFLKGKNIQKNDNSAMNFVNIGLIFYIL